MFSACLAPCLGRTKTPTFALPLQTHRLKTCPCWWNGLLKASAEMIEGLSHITFIVRDLDRMGNILTGVLGAKKVHDSGAAMTTTCSSCTRVRWRIG